MAALFYSVRVFDGFEVTADNVRGALPQFSSRPGSRMRANASELRTALGTLALYSARKPEIP